MSSELEGLLGFLANVRAAAVAALLACRCHEPTYREVERIRSPDGRWDAVIALPLWGEYRGRTAVVVTRAEAGTRGRYPPRAAELLERAAATSEAWSGQIRFEEL